MADDRATEMGKYTDTKAEARKRASGTGAWEDYEGGSASEAVDSLVEQSRKMARKTASKAGAYKKRGSK